MFEYTPADISNQIAALGPAMSIWLRVMGIVNLSSLFFLRHMQARWVLAAFLFIAATNVPIFLSFGLIKLGSVPHLVVWIPLVVYLAREFRHGNIDVKTVFGAWSVVVMLIVLVSVVFDVRDSAEYLLGDNTQMAIDPDAAPPYLTLLAIGVSITSVIAYSFGYGKPDRPGKRTAI